MQDAIKYLHPLELKVLFYFQVQLSYQKQSISASDIVTNTTLLEGQINQAISWLLGKSYIEEREKTVSIWYERTPFGEEWNSNKTPYRRIIEYVQNNTQSYGLQDIAKSLNIEAKDIGSAFGVLSKAHVLRLNCDKQVEYIDGAEYPFDLVNLELLLQKKDIEESQLTAEQIHVIEQYAKKRGSSSVPFRRIEREQIQYALSNEGIQSIEKAKKLGLTGEEIGSLTVQMLKDKSWEAKSFRSYNISLPPNRVSMGKRNSYSQFLQNVKDQLVGLGFEEFDGSLVQTEFWNSDALFMPQFHAARDIHDVYYLDDPTHAKTIDEPWLSNVAKVHEDGGNTGSRGWKYSFDKHFTKRLILRSQGTVMSAKTLPHANIPGKYFGILRVFRRDKIDSTHLSDFYQTEGIILGKDVNLRTLLGLLRVFAEEIAHAEEVRYVPGYFPFTEPSIEVHIKHPKIGWMELGGSGIFRPEVTAPLGIHVPVAAWGIGIDRMATMQMNISDLRNLFSYDLEKVLYRKTIMQ